MAKILLSTANAVLWEVELAKERITIGRGPQNDIVIDDGAISAEHAVIVTVGDDAFLEDLNSTNGSQVNGQPVRKHFLQNGDVIEMAQYRIEYVTHQAGVANGAGDENGAERLSAYTASEKTVAVIQILNGPNVGKEIRLVKPLTTFGRPGMQAAALVRRGCDYYLTHIEGASYPLVNGIPIDMNARRIVSSDIIDLIGMRVQFLKGC
jgi:pSer/pThr/pTyr-binding forkhead associated (FHA) protein